VTTSAKLCLIVKRNIEILDSIPHDKECDYL